MKTRTSLVSNSSSSSFIIAIAKVIDKSKLLTFIESLNIDKYDYEIVKVSDIKDRFITTNEKIIVRSFMDNEVTLNKDLLNDDDEIIGINIVNNEGDCGMFSGCNDQGEYTEINYDIDLEDLPYNQVALYEGLGESNGVSNVDKMYGAGRNG